MAAGPIPFAPHRGAVPRRAVHLYVSSLMRSRGGFGRLRLFVFAALALYTTVQACEQNTPCDKCAKDSEMSWNPENRFVSERLSRFYSLDDEIKKAYIANDFATVKKLCGEYLEL